MPLAAASAWLPGVSSQSTCACRERKLAGGAPLAAQEPQTRPCPAAPACQAHGLAACPPMPCSPLSQARTCLSPHLDDGHAAAVLGGQLLQHRHHHPAGAAPAGRKVDEHQLHSTHGQEVGGWVCRGEESGGDACTRACPPQLPSPAPGCAARPPPVCRPARSCQPSACAPRHPQSPCRSWLPAMRCTGAARRRANAAQYLMPRLARSALARAMSCMY